MQRRNMGKQLFMDEGTLQVPFVTGSMTDDAFISAKNPANTAAGEPRTPKLRIHIYIFLTCYTTLLSISSEPVTWHVWPPVT